MFIYIRVTADMCELSELSIMLVYTGCSSLFRNASPRRKMFKEEGTKKENFQTHWDGPTLIRWKKILCPRYPKTTLTLDLLSFVFPYE